MNRSRSLAKLSFGLSLIFGMIGCGKLDQVSSPGGSAGVGITTTTIPVVFSVDVGTIWESDTSTVPSVLGTCSISTNSPSNTLVCPTIAIPEAELYFGKLVLQAHVKNLSKCSVLSFFPYYYQMSNQANFLPTVPLAADSSFAAIDCSSSPTPVGCFMGPATKIVTGFGTSSSTGIYLLPATNPDPNWTIDSANSVRVSSHIDPGNRWTTNDLVTASRLSSYFDVNGKMVYLANSMQDYIFECNDIYDDTQYRVTLKLGVNQGISYDHANWQSNLLGTTTTTTIPASATTTTSAPTTTTTTLPVFEVNFSTSWQTDASNTLTQASGSPCTFSSTDASPKSCSGLSVPEAELYSGKLTINAKINDTSRCKIFKFMPYYYRMSGQDSFVPVNADVGFTPLNCQTSPSVGCYSGPATQLIPSFPSNMNPLRYFTSVSSNLSWTVDSAETMRTSLKYDPGNRWTTNDLATPAVAQQDYVANSMIPYRFECDDANGIPQYVMTAQLAVDSGAPGSYSNWQSALVPAVTTTTTTTTNPQIFQINVGTIWETDTANTVIPQGSCSFSVTDGSSKNCNLSIPEAELYYGKLKLEAAITNQSKCGVFLFQPYYYMMGNSASFIPSTANSSFGSLDCSGATSTPPVGCYAGAAVSIIPNFPAFRRIYSVTSVTPNMSWTASSAVNVAASANYDPGNRWTTNDLVDRATAQTDYVSNSMQDYVFSCRDVNDDPIYSLTLKISVIPGSGGYDESHW